MDISEKELEDLIFNSDQRKVQEKGLELYDHQMVFRQFDLGVYGIADIIGVDYSRVERHGALHITVYELKKGMIGHDTLGQCLRYKDGIMRHFGSLLPKRIAPISMIMIGGSIDMDSDFAHTASKFRDTALYTYKFNMYDGISFEHYHPVTCREEKTRRKTWRSLSPSKWLGEYRKLYKEAKGLDEE